MILTNRGQATILVIVVFVSCGLANALSNKSQCAESKGKTLNGKFVFRTVPAVVARKDWSTRKEWQPNEIKILEDCLLRATQVAPNLIDIVCKDNCIALYRVQQTVIQPTYARLNSGIATFTPGSLTFSDNFFEATEQERLDVTLHELTHACDQLDLAAFSPPWIDYFHRNFTTDKAYRFDEPDEGTKVYSQSLVEALADTYPRYLTGKKISDKDFFVAKIVPLLITRNAKELKAANHYVLGRLALDRNNFEEAERQLRTAQEILPQTIELTLFSAMANWGMKKPMSALQATAECLHLIEKAQLPPEEDVRIQTYILRAACLLAVPNKDPGEAKRLIELAMQYRPTDPVLIKLLQICDQGK